MKTLLLACTLPCLSLLAFEQEGLLKSLGNTAKEKANAQDFNTTRNNKERGNLMDEKAKQSAPAPAPGSAPAESAEPVSTESTGDYQASYQFSSQVTYQIEHAKKPGESQTIHYCFGDQVVEMQANGQDMSSIIDSKNQVMIMLNEKNKTATVMSMKAMEAAMQHEQMGQGQKPAAKITKTGRTKTILGYTCEEVLIESDRKTEVWISNEPGIDASKTLAGMSLSAAGQVPKEAFVQGGMMMEMTAYDAAGKPETHLLVTALSKESKTIAIGAYKITKL